MFAAHRHCGSLTGTFVGENRIKWSDALKVGTVMEDTVRLFHLEGPKQVGYSQNLVSQLVLITSLTEKCAKVSKDAAEIDASTRELTACTTDMAEALRTTGTYRNWIWDKRQDIPVP